jgi:hypothetical protein
VGGGGAAHWVLGTQPRPRVLKQAARLTSRRFRCPLTIQVVVTFTPAAKPQSEADAPEAYEDKLKAVSDREQGRKGALGAVVNLDEIAAWPKSEC